MDDAPVRNAPVSNWDAAVVIVRLQKRLGEPPLKLTAEGGGLNDSHALEFGHAVVIERAELETVIRLLRSVPFQDCQPDAISEDS